jgi:Spy/CpxP family protein refolding chaperone
MKKPIAIIFTLALLLTVSFSYNASASEQNPGQSDGPRHGREHRFFGARLLGRMARFLELTDTQKTEIKSIIQAEKPTIEPIVRQIAQNRKDMREATKNGTFDEAQVRTLANQRAQALSELIVARERLKTKIYNILTSEQKDKLEQLKERRGEHMKRRRSS